MVQLPILEKIFLFAMVVAKEGDGVGHHPDVSPAAVVVGLVPLPVLGQQANSGRRVEGQENLSLRNFKKGLIPYHETSTKSKRLRLLQPVFNLKIFSRAGFTEVQRGLNSISWSSYKD